MVKPAYLACQRVPIQMCTRLPQVKSTYTPLVSFIFVLYQEGGRMGFDACSDGFHAGQYFPSCFFRLRCFAKAGSFP